MTDAIFNTEKEKNQSLIPHGLLSKTTIHCHLGILTEGSWIGDDFSILNTPSNYTVTASTIIYVLEIPARKIHSFPTETLSELSLKAKSKIEWNAERCYELDKTNIGILNLDKTNRVYQKSVMRVKERFPSANRRALSNLRDLLMKKEQYDKIESLYKLANPYVIQRVRRGATSALNKTVQHIPNPYNNEHSRENNEKKSLVPIVFKRPQFSYKKLQPVLKYKMRSKSIYNKSRKFNNLE